ncbi:MAG: DUF4115 domain-containing protein [Candidatus Aminicenantes bacterium]|nr:DUF4115 domain-containing protein [Candidatus Aminicenantes bacterium]
MGNFGKYLRERRNAKGITAEYIALHSSLNENILNALENENHEFFKSSFYFSNFLNNYLEFLEIDRERFYIEFSEELDSLKHNEDKQVLKSMTGLRYSKFRNRKLIIKGIILGIVVAIFFYLLFINKGLVFSLFEQEEIIIPETGISVSGLPEREADFSPVNLDLHFSDDCWMRVLKGGEIVTERVFTAGEYIKISGYELKLIMSNPSVVDISINKKRTEKYRKVFRTTFIKITPDTIDKAI